jgi:phage recombination protein Bet
MSKEIVVSQEKVLSIPEVEEKTIIEYMDAFGLSNKLLPNEKKAFINIAKEFGLNPFKREIHCTAYGSGDYRTLSIVTGYDVYIKRAERIGRLDGWSAVTEGTGKDLKAIVTIYRKDWSKPFVHEVYFTEVQQTKKDGTPNSFWLKMPRFMTKKTAIAQAFRLCFPDEFGGMPYTADEVGLETADIDTQFKQQEHPSEQNAHGNTNPKQATVIAPVIQSNNNTMTEEEREFDRLATDLVSYTESGMLDVNISAYITTVIDTKQQIAVLKNLLLFCNNIEQNGSGDYSQLLSTFSMLKHIKENMRSAYKENAQKLAEANDKTKIIAAAQKLTQAMNENR